MNRESLEEPGKCGTNPGSQAPSRMDPGYNDRDEIRTEPEQEQDRQTHITKKKMVRHRFSLKKTRTQYEDMCGICGEWHTHKVALALCICGAYVHLKCLGWKRGAAGLSDGYQPIEVGPDEGVHPASLFQPGS